MLIIIFPAHCTLAKCMLFIDYIVLCAIFYYAFCGINLKWAIER